VQKFDHDIGFWEKRQFFRQKLPKIAENCDYNIDLRSLHFIAVRNGLNCFRSPCQVFFIWQFIFTRLPCIQGTKKRGNFSRFSSSNFRFRLNFRANLFYTLLFQYGLIIFKKVQIKKSENFRFFGAPCREHRCHCKFHNVCNPRQDFVILTRRFIFKTKIPIWVNFWVP
jgi:hypothetical protein